MTPCNLPPRVEAIYLAFWLTIPAEILAAFLLKKAVPTEELFWPAVLLVWELLFTFEPAGLALLNLGLPFVAEDFEESPREAFTILPVPGEDGLGFWELGLVLLLSPISGSIGPTSLPWLAFVSLLKLPLRVGFELFGLWLELPAPPNFTIWDWLICYGCCKGPCGPPIVTPLLSIAF